MHLTQDPDAHPVALDLYLLARLGADYYAWDLATVCAVVMAGNSRGWSAPYSTPGPDAEPIPEINRHKIEAIRVTRANALALTNAFVFEKVVAAFNNIIPDFETMQKPTLGHLLVAVPVLLRPGNDNLSEEVWRYVAAALITDGLVAAPAPLTGANPALRSLCRPPDLHDRMLASLTASPASATAEEREQIAMLREGELYSTQVNRRLLEQLERMPT